MSSITIKNLPYQLDINCDKKLFVDVSLLSLIITINELSYGFASPTIATSKTELSARWMIDGQDWIDVDSITCDDNGKCTIIITGVHIGDDIYVDVTSPEGSASINLILDSYSYTIDSLVCAE